MNKGQVVELAKKWVEIDGSRTRGFLGPHITGGINYHTAAHLVATTDEIER